MSSKSTVDEKQPAKFELSLVLLLPLVDFTAESKVSGLCLLISPTDFLSIFR